jgi:hypothetical protein
LGYWTKDEMDQFIRAWIKYMSASAAADPQANELFQLAKETRKILGEWPE